MYKVFSIFLLSVVGAMPIIAQNVLPLWFHTIEKKDGLTAIDNRTFFKDSEGFVWISSYAGLNRFDGQKIKPYHSNPQDPTSLYGEMLDSDFFEDSDKNIWFCTNQAIHRYNRKTDNFNHFFVKNKSEEIKQEYSGIFLERDSLFWVKVGDDYLYKFNIHDYQSEVAFDSLKYFIYYAPVVSNDGTLKKIFISNGGLSPGLEELQIKNDKITSIIHFDGRRKQEPVLKIQSVIYHNESNIWLSGNTGLFKWNKEKNTCQLINKHGNSARFILPYKENQLLIGQQDVGFSFIDQASHKISSIPSFSINDISFQVKNVFTFPYLDNSNNLWLSFKDNGVLFANIEKTKFRHLPQLELPTQRKDYTYRSMAYDKEGRIWTSTYFEGVFLLDKKGDLIQYFDTNNSNLPSNSIYFLFKDNEANIWLATQNGASLFDYQTNSFKTIFDKNHNPIRGITCIWQLTDNILIANSRTKGICRIYQEGGKWIIVPLLQNRSQANFDNVYQDKLGTIYLNKDYSNILTFSIELDSLVPKDTIQIGGLVNRYYEAPGDTTLWIAASTGLYQLDKTNLKKTPKYYGEKEGAINKNFQSLLVDDRGRFWFGTGNGLAIFYPEDESFHYFSQADGVGSTQMDCLAAVEYLDGSFWFAGNNGITIIDDPSSFSPSKKSPQIQITDFKINYESSNPFEDTCFLTGATNIGVIKQLRLPPYKNTLSFNFVAIDYTDPKSTQLKFQFLRKKEKADNWIVFNKGEAGFANFLDLSSGEYIFRIMASNSDGLWSPETVKELEFVIEKKLIEKLWFQVLIFLFLCLLAYSIYRYRITQIQEKATLQTRAAENKMAALRAQMNPHFVFNSLQTLNGFITRKDMRGAIQYVSEFAKLMRMILENSREGSIALEKEIELLELYMKVEARRFEKPFTFNISVAQEVDTYETEIPAMLLQPFVENAIKHGLFHKKEAGQIDIAFNQENGLLKCVVQDNGIGRAKAAELNAQSGRKHKSQGLKIIKEQLQIIRQSNEGNYDYQIIDLYDRQQNPSGTRVELLLPIND